MGDYGLVVWRYRSVVCAGRGVSWVEVLKVGVSVGCGGRGISWVWREGY